MTGLSVNHNERGAAGVEYGILLAAIASIIIVVVFSIGSKVSGLYTDVLDLLNTYI